MSEKPKQPYNFSGDSDDDFDLFKRPRKHFTDEEIDAYNAEISKFLENIDSAKIRKKPLFSQANFPPQGIKLTLQMEYEDEVMLVLGKQGILIPESAYTKDVKRWFIHEFALKNYQGHTHPTLPLFKRFQQLLTSKHY